MKTIRIIGLCLVSLLGISHTTLLTSKSHTSLSTKVIDLDSCFYNGKQLYGKVKLVEYANEADIKVKIVNSFPDLKVKFVESFPDDCGEWEIVEHHADVNVYITESFPDLEIQIVNTFPGLR